MCSDEQVLAQARDGDVIWLSVRSPVWRETLTQCVRQRPNCPVVVISLAPDTAQAFEAISMGAKGYCHQLAHEEQLTEVAYVVSHSGLWLGPDLLQRVAQASHAWLSHQRSQRAVPSTEAHDWQQLTQRELEVAMAVAQGQTNKVVARQLDITERTVKAHLSAIFDKMQLRDRLHLVLAMQQSPIRADMTQPD